MNVTNVHLLIGIVAAACSGVATVAYLSMNVGRLVKTVEVQGEAIKELLGYKNDHATRIATLEGETAFLRNKGCMHAQ